MIGEDQIHCLISWHDRRGSGTLPYMMAYIYNMRGSDTLSYMVAYDMIGSDTFTYMVV